MTESKYAMRSLTDLMNTMIEAEQTINGVKKEIKRRGMNDDDEVMEYVRMDWAKLRQMAKYNRKPNKSAY